MPGPTETCSMALCQILTLGNALQPEVWPFLNLMLALKFLILDILMVYEDIWGYKRAYGSIRRYMGVYEGICVYTPLLTASHVLRFKKADFHGSWLC